MTNQLIASVDIRNVFRPALKFQNETWLGPTVGDLYNIAIALAFVIAFLLVIWGGIKLITSGGDAKAVESGRKTITFAIVGLVLIIVAYFIVWVMGMLTGVKVIE